MKKIFNIILIILIIIAIIVGAMIVKKYYNEWLNLKDISDFFKNIGNSLNYDKEIYYKGYKVVGFIEIPKIEIKYPILSETTEESMLISVTKFWGPDINKEGNFTIAGHNNYSGTMFGKTKKLELGDIIKLTDLNNNTVDYIIFDKYSVDPNDTSCVDCVEQGKRETTLITCTKGHEERLIIKAREAK